jgi:hypothetical protein
MEDKQRTFWDNRWENRNWADLLLTYMIKKSLRKGELIVLPRCVIWISWEGGGVTMAEEFIDLQRSLYPDLAAKYEVLGSLYNSK